jgi:hypothetical protein
MLHDLLLALSGLSAGRRCRRCGDPIVPGDHLGLGEGVCPGCRL